MEAQQVIWSNRERIRGNNYRWGSRESTQAGLTPLILHMGASLRVLSGPVWSCLVPSGVCNGRAAASDLQQTLPTSPHGGNLRQRGV